MSRTKPAPMSAPSRRRMADQFVERIVAADILARRDHLALGVAQGGGVDGAGFGVERLVRADRLERAEDRRAARSRPARTASAMAAAPAPDFRSRTGRRRIADAVAHPLQHPIMALVRELDAEQDARSPPRESRCRSRPPPHSISRSERAKPMAKSSISEGVAIITA